MSINHEERSISRCQHHQTNYYCRNCGLYIHQNKALKTERYETHCQISPHKYLQQINKRATQICIPPKQLTYYSSTLLQAICDKFQFNLQTLALGIYYYQYLQSREERKKLQQKNNKNSASQNYKDQCFYTSICLIIAAKAIQLDRKVPYLNRYQRYADRNHTKEQYEIEERLICQALNYNFQFSTFITFLNFFMTAGILFQSDSLNTFQVALIEDDINRKAKQIVQSGNFIKYQPKKLAISIIMEIRKKYGLQAMNNELRILTGYQQSNQQKQITILKPIKKQYNVSSIFESKYNTIRGKKSNIFQESTTKQNFHRQFQLYTHKQSNSQYGLTKSMSTLRPSTCSIMSSHIKQAIEGKNVVMGNIGNYLISKRK